MRHIVERMNRKLGRLEDVHQRVANSVIGKLIPVQRPDNAAIREENDFNQIFKAARDGLDTRAIRQAANQRACAPARPRSIRTPEIITIRIACRKIKPAVRTEGQAMEAAIVAVPETR